MVLVDDSDEICRIQVLLQGGDVGQGYLSYDAR
jgi:hypothetical protein